MTSSFNQQLENPYHDIAPEILEGIDKVGGHSLAQMMVLAYGSNPDRNLAISELMPEFIGQEDTTTLSRSSVQGAHRKLTQKLEWLSETRANNGVQVRCLSEKGKTFGLVLCHQLVEWQAAYPEPQFALAKVLGKETVQAERERATPTLRFGLYRLLSETDEPLLAQRRGALLCADSYDTHNENVALGSRGIVQVAYVKGGNGRRTTKVTLAPEFKDPLRELVSRIVAVGSITP